ncbi:MAG: N-acetylmuramoyl-L-alanine amidase [Clostridiales bacterium]|nr:N-acetylmuramoyl-L-alanine amidase [Clostridiales bacterium]
MSRQSKASASQHTPPSRARKPKRHPLRNILLIAAAAAALLMLLGTDGLPTLSTSLLTSTGTNAVLPTGDASPTPGVAASPGTTADSGSLIVCIDPGHGGSDQGTSYQGRLESEDNLALALAVREAMEAQGIAVVMTREDDTFVSRAERAAIANDAGADFFLSLHRNASSDGSGHGIEIWYSTAASATTVAWAAQVEDALAAVGVSGSRGCRSGSQTDPYEDYDVCRLTKMPALIVEMGFIQSEEDNRLFDDQMEDYAKALTDAVLAVWAAQQGN